MRKTPGLVLGLTTAAFGCIVVFSLLMWNCEERNEEARVYWNEMLYGDARMAASEAPSRSSLSTSDETLNQQNSTQASNNSSDSGRWLGTTTALVNTTTCIPVNESLQDGEDNQHPLEPPVSQPRDCKQPNCLEFLVRKDQLVVRICKRTLDTYFRKFRHVKDLIEFSDGSCSFMNGEHRLPIALASTEGSGNTWIRGLLEKVTGICTGFIWCDPIMRAHGFIGENVKSGSVLVVKTHTFRPQWHSESPHSTGILDYEAFYGSAIYILRNPCDSLIAERNRVVTTNLVQDEKKRMESHTSVVGEGYWRGPDWEKFIHKYMQKWRQRLENWVITVHDKPVHVVRYEDLKANTFQEVMKMLDFISIDYEENAVCQRLLEDYDHFKRIHKDDHFDHYNDEQRQHISSVLYEMIETAKQHNKSEILRLEEYILTPCH